MASYSLCSIGAGRFRVAASPDSTAITASGTASMGVMPTWCAKTCQHSRPPGIPAGTPITRAIPASVSACQQSVPRACHEVKPSARMIAKSRRRRRTEVISLGQRSDLGDWFAAEACRAGVGSHQQVLSRPIGLTV